MVYAHGGGDYGFEVKGAGELGEGEMQHFGFVVGNGKEFISAGEDDLDWLAWTTGDHSAGRGGPPT